MIKNASTIQNASTRTALFCICLVGSGFGSAHGSELTRSTLSALPQVRWIHEIDGAVSPKGTALDETSVPTDSDGNRQATAGFAFMSDGEFFENQRLMTEIELAATEEPVTFLWSSKQGDTSSRLRVWGDPDDSGLVHLELATLGKGEDAKRERFRLWPLVERWSQDKDERLEWAEEFKSLPGWEHRWFRVAIDFTASGTRIGFEGRMIWAQAKSLDRANRLEMIFPKGANGRRQVSLPLPERQFLPIDLSSYHNNDALEGGDLGDGFAFANESLQGHGMASIADIPFQVEWTRGQNNNCDLGVTEFRAYYPYIYCDALASDPKRIILRVPKRYYDRAHLVCVADKEENAVPSAAIRMIKTGRGHAASSMYDVPHWDGEPGRALPLECGEMASRDGGTTTTGKMWLVSVPMNPGDFQDFLSAEDEAFLELDLTRLIGIVDNKYPRPMGPTSSVHLFALTLEEAPAKMVVTSQAIGHIFEHPQRPTMQVQLTSQRSERREYELAVETVGPYGQRVCEKHRVVLDPHDERTESITLSSERMGKYDVTFHLAEREGERSITRSTSYALLPRYSRQVRDDSPFGVWCFFEQHFGAGPEIAGPLLKLLGARWTLPNFLCNAGPEENAKRVELLGRYGVSPSFGYLCGIANTGWKGPGDVDAKIEELHATPWVKNYNVFWETSASRRTRDIIPPEIMGRAPLELTDEELENLRNCRETGVAYSSRAREDLPDAKFIFGNGFPFFIGCMLRQGYPAEYIDGFGLDFDLYTSMPERQPGIPYAPFCGLYFLKELQKIYGYEGYPRYLTEAIYAPEAPGWLTEREQADHYVRTHLLALAAGVEYFGMCTEVWDPGGWFGYGHYGPVGLCHRPPELNPRESFCAYATMTAMLEGCRYERMLDMGSPSVFGLEFRRSEIEPVYVFWTIRGERSVTLQVKADTEIAMTDCPGNKQTRATANRSLDIRVTSSPLYIEGIDSVANVVLGDVEYENEPKATESLVTLDSLEHWTQEKGRYEALEEVNPAAPLVAADLELGIERNEQLAHAGLVVGLPETVGWHPIETGYSVLTRTGSELPIPESASEIGAWVYGNSSWGRILFELKDADDRRWLSARSESSYVDFDGYRYIGIDLPHMPRGKHVEPTGFRFWVCDTENAEPSYPLTLTRLIFETRSHTIRGGDIEVVPVPQYYVNRIVYTEEN